MLRKYDLTNQRFHSLIALEYIGRGYWKCTCDCGSTFNAVVTRLRNGQSKSCGCHSHKSNRGRTTHGFHRTPEYWVWLSMKRRCKPTSPDAKYYYSAGVSIYPEWKESFEAFYSYVGPRPSSDHSIDRYPNPAGNYEPGNVRWALPAEQRRNQRRGGCLITFQGRTQHAIDWARELGINTSVISRRLHKGWAVERVLRRP